MPDQFYLTHKIWDRTQFGQRRETYVSTVPDDGDRYFGFRVSPAGSYESIDAAFASLGGADWYRLFNIQQDAPAGTVGQFRNKAHVDIPFVEAASYSNMAWNAMRGEMRMPWSVAHVARYWHEFEYDRGRLVAVEHLEQIFSAAEKHILTDEPIQYLDEETRQSVLAHCRKRVAWRRILDSETPVNTAESGRLWAHLRASGFILMSTGACEIIANSSISREAS